MKKKRINVMEGELTFGQRLELGERLGSVTPSTDDLVLASDVFEILYSNKPSARELYDFIQTEYESVLEGLKHWIDVESELLHYEPTNEEVAAGANSIQTAQMGTAYKLARDFGKDPDDVLAWQYSKVFGILWNDAEMARFERRYSKILQAKK